MSRAIHRKPFSLSRLSVLAYNHSPFNDHGEPVSSLLDRTLRLKAAFVRFFCPSIICFVSRSLSHWKWPGHGSSRRPRHQRHWSKNRWGADQPFGSDCPWQPWRNGRLSKGYLSSHFSPFSTFSNLRNLERLALVFAARKSEAPWLGGVLPVKQRAIRSMPWIRGVLWGHKSLLYTHAVTDDLFRWTSIRSFTMMSPTRGF